MLLSATGYEQSYVYQHVRAVQFGADIYALGFAESPLHLIYPLSPISPTVPGLKCGDQAFGLLHANDDACLGLCVPRASKCLQRDSPLPPASFADERACANFRIVGHDVMHSLDFGIEIVPTIVAAPCWPNTILSKCA